VRTPGEIERLGFLGTTVEVLVDSRDTDGAWSLISFTAPGLFRGSGAHHHEQTTETFYVLSGRLRFRLNGEHREYGAGSVVVVPPGLVHAVSNPYDEPVRVLIHCTPGGFEGYYREVADLAARAPTWPPIDLSALSHLAERFDTFCL